MGVILDPAGALRFSATVQDIQGEKGTFAWYAKPNVAIGLITVAELNSLCQTYISEMQPAMNGAILSITVAIKFIEFPIPNPSSDIFNSVDDSVKFTLLGADGDTTQCHFPSPTVTDFLLDTETPDFSGVFGGAVNAIIGPTIDGTNNWEGVSEDGSGNPMSYLKGKRNWTRRKGGGRAI